MIIHHKHGSRSQADTKERWLPCLYGAWKAKKQAFRWIAEAARNQDEGDHEEAEGKPKNALSAVGSLMAKALPMVIDYPGGRLKGQQPLQVILLRTRKASRWQRSTNTQRIVVSHQFQLYLTSKLIIINCEIIVINFTINFIINFTSIIY